MKHSMIKEVIFRAKRTTTRLKRHGSISIFFILFIMSLAPQILAPTLENSKISSNPIKNLDLSADDPTLNLTYYSYWNSNLNPVNSGDKLEGDHITLNATYAPNDIVNRTRIEVNLTALDFVIYNEANQTSLELDTRQLGNNGTCTINVTAWLFNGSVITDLFTNVFIGNFFAPHVTVLSPNGGESWIGEGNITWTAWDTNTEELLTYEVLLSSDSGNSFQLIAAGLTTTWFVWDSTGFYQLSTYLIEVRVHDGIYTGWDRSDSTFTAGTVHTGTTTATTTETATPSTTDTPAPPAADLSPAIFISVSIISSAFFAVVVYFMAKRRF